MLPVVILAGGLATRLYPVTRKVPKALLILNGRPFIDYQLRLLKEKGIMQVVLCVGYLGEEITEFVGDGSHWGLEVTYSSDGDTLLGTGGAIRKATDLLPDEFIILYGDSYLDIDYASVVWHFYMEKLPVLMTVYRNQDAFDKSNIIMKGRKVIRYDKNSHDPAMQYIDYGLIVTKKEVFEEYPPDKPFDLALILSRMADSGLVAGLEVKERFYEIGSILGMKETEDYVRKRISNHTNVEKS
jgi:N-acetyl-alpha-D-muramate 1-phosphate uridylyltransferase